jgi:hypothetical protein
MLKIWLMINVVQQMREKWHTPSRVPEWHASKIAYNVND